MVKDFGQKQVIGFDEIFSPVVKCVQFELY